MKIIISDEIIRITAGGNDKDFTREEEKEASEYFMEMVKKWKYASMRFMCNFQRIEE